MSDAAVLDGELVGANGDDVLAREEQESFAAAASEQGKIPLSLIRKSEVALRDAQRQSEEYAMLLQSVKQRGVLNSITVREQFDPLTKTKFYGLIDGLQRFTAATDAGHTHIPANIVKMDDAEVLEAQLITNLNRIQTRPVDQSKHLLRILARNPFMTKQDLCERICQSIGWLEQRLGLSGLAKPVADLVNAGKINLTNAYSLSKIPEEEQPEHVDAAMNESPKTFVPRMKARVKEIRDSRKKGDDVGKAEFKPVQYMQKISDVKSEFEKGCPTLVSLLELNNVTTVSEAAKLAVAWVLHFDPQSQEEQRRDYEAKAAQREVEKAKQKEEREQKKQAAAVAAKADITGGW